VKPALRKKPDGRSHRKPRIASIFDRHCAGAAKNSGEKRVIVSPGKTTTKGRKQGKRGQLSQA
jgi:hypothetical protein